ncbi:MAG: D-alanine--D-alanine ligase [Clostridiales bacterium]|jgi:D-alanine-D-alanine ligase|nr:D-alanine--D-alanine ligase [Clostridiales bacterium]
MSKTTVAVLFGGRSTEHEVSIMSAMNVISSIPPEKYYVLPIYITRDGRWLLYEGAAENIRGASLEKIGVNCIVSPDLSHGGLLRIVGGKARPVGADVVFPVLHGKNGEDGTVQGLCELAGIPVVGCGALSSAVSMDKAFTNLIAKASGIAHTPYVVAHRNEMGDTAGILRRTRKLGYPCFVKPANAGSSVGVSKAGGKRELIAALEKAFEHDRKAIIEKAVAGRELECAVLGGDEPSASPVGEVISAAEFYDYDAKYHNDESRAIVPADIPEDKAEEIRAAALAVFAAVDGSGMARADFFLEEGTGRVLFNEINTIPGFTAVSLYPALWREAGITREELCDRLIGIALERGRRD